MNINEEHNTMSASVLADESNQQIYLEGTWRPEPQL